MLAAKNFQSGLQTLRQIEFALFDMHLHTDFDPDGEKTAQQLLDEIREQVAVIIPPEFNRFPNSFSIFLGEAMRRDTIATSGRKYCLPTPTAYSKKLLPARL